MTTEVEKFENIIRDLEDKRQDAIRRSTELADERQRVSFAAHTGDGKARARLDKINSESSTHAGEIASIIAAITEATARLESAKRAEASAADRDKAKQVAGLNTKFKEELENAADAFSDAIGSVLTARDLLMEIHALGVTSPTDQMYRINAVASMKSALQLLPNTWINDFEFMRLSPSQKKSFKPLAAGWFDQITNQIASRLGENKEVA